MINTTHRYPRYIQVIAPLIRKEYIYKVLQVEHRELLKQIAIEGRSSNQINDAIEHIINNYKNSFKILGHCKNECISLPVTLKRLVEVM